MDDVAVQEPLDFGADLREKMTLVHDAAAENDFFRRNLQDLADAGLSDVIRERVPERVIFSEFIARFTETVLN